MGNHSNNTRFSSPKEVRRSMKIFNRLTTFICLVILCLSTLVACLRNQQVQTIPPPIETQSVQTTPSPIETEVIQTTLPPIESQAFPPSPVQNEPQVDLVPGDTTLSLIYAGIERTYILHIPPGFGTAQMVPLVMAFHGFGLDANEMIRISGINAQSDASGFIAVYPNGTGENKSWNGGHCCGDAAKNNVDDIGFVRALVGELSTFINIDPKRIYVTGFSNGAIFTYRVACELSDLIAAVGPVSATPFEEDMKSCNPSRPVPIIHFHGTADEANPYNGGKSLPGFQFFSVDTAIQFWVNSNGCPTQPQTNETGSIRHDIYSPCTANTAVELYSITDGMHAWPGGEAVNQKMGEPTMEISATSLMWDFFVAHPMP